jgi:hypothetical protein
MWRSRLPNPGSRCCAGLARILSALLLVTAYAVLTPSQAQAKCSRGGPEIGIGIGVPGFGTVHLNPEECNEEATQAPKPKKPPAKKVARPAVVKITAPVPKTTKAAPRKEVSRTTKSRSKKPSVAAAAEPKPKAKSVASKPKAKSVAKRSRNTTSPASEPPPKAIATEKPKQPAPQPDKTGQSDLLAAKDAALKLLQQAALPLPQAASERLRTAIEATTQSLAEALKQNSLEIIQARTEILAGLLEEAGKPENQALQPSIQIGGQSRSGEAAEATQLPAAAPGERRVALVIGNSAYRNATELANPRSDAKLISATLAGLGFDVIEGEDLDKAGMEGKVREFAIKQSDADVSLFFYAGHGMQVAGRNYLVPIDAKLEDSTAIDFETIQLDSVLGYMTGPKKVAIALLDACRDNPLSRRFANVVGASRSSAIGRGLAMPSMLGGGLLIGFATAPGEIALDGADRNSPFTKALSKYLPVKGLEIQQLMTEVKADVYESTHGEQSPWHNSDLRQTFFLKP